MGRRAYQFFKANAGGIVGESALGAAMLARAEEALVAAVDAGAVRVLWEWEEDIDDSWMSEREPWEQPHEWTRCAIVRDIVCDRGHKHVEYLASLGGIVDADASYRRVIEAELAAECEAELCLA